MRGIATAGLLAVLMGLGAGCTTVKFIQKNPYTGETWTVYQNVIGSDTITYCPPHANAPCREVTFVDGSAPQQPPAVYPAAGVPQ